ncbi:tyrosine-type DNA invertase [Providencia stuartii]|uniref:tyrosine-type DNA invertase n=1 Tax=Providencia stuartii TaxID=588 RepID=UPI000D896B8F|nr:MULTISPECIES: tyrosine-type DNA invertase [Providencia]MTB79037.1 tyrosine-type recombinase/integrase [Providencia stuartii]MTC12062.1 tyrosine-type recombinase/integrase [Providencia stuartii]MTC67506.1 tyrosine-type recombinase/integrase [Providencia stuartii]SPY69291.1 Tyrosine recombinase XerC [Providencia stuartii]GHB93985.1 tyrosine recombinase [Providencia thailandensis]
MKQRKFLTRKEIDALLQATTQGRYAERDYCLLLMGFFHGFRVSELSRLAMNDVDLTQGVIYVRRLKRGLSTIQPLHPQEIKAIRAWLKKRKLIATAENNWFFLSQKQQALSRSQIFRLMEAYGKRANLTVKVHPHMLRHACGYALADLGRDTRLIQDYLGHRNISHTVIYTASNQKRFTGIWGA